MRQLYIFILVILFGNFGFAQITYVQIELVNPQMGEPIFMGNAVPVSTSTDDGLNAIFSLHETSFYESLYPSSSNGFYNNSYSLYAKIRCNSCDESELISDLLEYNTVVAYAGLETENFLINGLYIHLVDDTIGIPTGVSSNGIIETNDTLLNQLFLDYNVVTFELNDSNWGGNTYNLKCRCDSSILKAELDNYVSLISTATPVDYGMLLSTEDSIQFEAKIYPQPFKDKVNIDINQPIKSLVLFDVLGKQVYKSSSIIGFENFSSTLKSGVYLLKILTSEGESITKKLIKS
ncbi:T9SS type A sorting domain-containing protein [Winogradskyella sp. 4-2091]|uniref:T9SS type A sorting domain-containing protein n=1 Tax=Winogradskyella sp. 4-2091 TaxID=3381659 RepID=UPI0038927347